MFFLQMSGFPGSGKSTLARVIAQHTGAVIVDHDIVKSALLEAVEDQLDGRAAGQASYNIDWALVNSFLAQGHSVILDSPCLYEEMVDKGLKLCTQYGAQYKYVECYLNDIQEINRRLRTRERMISQIEQAASEEGFKFAVANSKKPADKKCLVVDSSKPMETYLKKVLAYINEE